MMNSAPLNFSLRSTFDIFGWFLTPLYQNTSTLGACSCISSIHWYRIVSGTITSVDLIFSTSLSLASNLPPTCESGLGFSKDKDTNSMVLPRPISSANIPLADLRRYSSGLTNSFMSLTIVCLEHRFEVNLLKNNIAGSDSDNLTVLNPKESLFRASRSFSSDASPAHATSAIDFKSLVVSS
ncbi:hypothetical protein WICPIJ_003505 [Wickerhamomyces pijperi]|uniref:Uncharacterized protein n=1 Tax=Wickerhamomyces pijperi TaxID=599730 RepID=A0A9P8Q9T8_WICPI|nr:hypothetical protein WICPIJ_003505 [Wickerhamomyces pijperi]